MGRYSIGTTSGIVMVVVVGSLSLSALVYGEPSLAGAVLVKKMVAQIVALRRTTLAYRLEGVVLARGPSDSH